MTNTLIAPTTLQEYTRTTGALPDLDTAITDAVERLTTTSLSAVEAFVVKQMADYLAAGVPSSLLELVEERSLTGTKWYVRIRPDVELTKPMGDA